MMMLGFVPMYDPLPALFPGMSEHWLWLAVPLVAAISVVYKCTRIRSLRALPREAGVMTVQILLVMVFAGLMLACGYWGYLHISSPAPR